MNFPKLPLKQFARVHERETSEAKYWKSFINTQEHSLQAAPNCIHFNPLSKRSINASSVESDQHSNFSYIVTGSIKVNLYDSTSDKLQKSFSRFNDDAFSGKFRKDGKLIVAGDKKGYVKVFDVQTKAVLRQLKRHEAAVRSTVWASDGLNILSGGDDKKVYKWDLATEEMIWSSKDLHADYVRAVDSSPISSDIFVSGCYDHSVRLWDSRQQQPIQTMVHDHPVECCMFTPSGAMLLTASGNEMKVWDLLGGGRLIHRFSNHQKNITSLAMDGSGTRVLSAGLDGHVKVHSLQSMQVTHGMKFGQPLSAVGMAPDNKKLVVGFFNGNLMIRTRRTNKGDAKSLPGTAATFGSLDTGASSRQVTLSRHYTGAGRAPVKADDGAVEHERAARLQPYEKCLKKFSYQKALNSALKTKNPLVVITVLEELSRRSGLTIALSGRDEETIEPLISFCARYVSSPKYSKLITLVVHQILDLYGGVIGHSEVIDELFLKLQQQVKAETVFQRQIMKVLGALDGIISVATMPPVTSA